MEARGLYIIRKARNAGYSGDPSPKARRKGSPLGSFRSMLRGALSARRDGKIPVLGRDFQILLVHQYFDVAVGRAAGYGLSIVSQGVLIPRFVRDGRVRIFDGVAREFRIRILTAGR